MVVCCAGFQELIESASARGFSVRAERVGESRAFFLHASFLSSSALTDELRTALSAVARATDAPSLSLEMSIAVNFCPHCGSNLRRWIAENPREFDRHSRRSSDSGR